LKRETIQMPSVVCNGAMGIERIEGPSQRIIIDVLGFDAGRKEPPGWFMLEKVRDPVAWLVDQAKPVGHPRFARRPRCDDTHFRVLVGRLVNDVAHPELVKHRGRESQMIEDLTLADLSRSVLRSGGESTALPNFLGVVQNIGYNGR
jgi:hypothetical protein